MERFDAHVGSVQPALEQAPEILHAVGVDPSVNILHGVCAMWLIVNAKNGISSCETTRSTPGRSSRSMLEPQEGTIKNGRD